MISFQDDVLQWFMRVVWEYNQTQRTPPQRKGFQCEYEDCCAIYDCWSIAESFNCPVCRKPIPKRRQASGKPLHFPSNVV